MDCKYFLMPIGVDAEQVSMEIYKIMYRENAEIRTKYAFGWLKKPDAPDVMVLDPNYIYPIYIKSNFESTVTRIGVALKNALADGEGQGLVEKLSSNERINLIELLPESFVEVEDDWLYENGYKRKAPPMI